MKANAPEKIYLQENTTTDLYEEWWPEWFSARAKDTDVEYTRTDAFIEKALKFLDENFFFNNSRYSIESGIFDSMEEMREEFKKYLEE